MRNVADADWGFSAESIFDRLSENASFLKFTHNYKGNTIAKVKIDDIIMSKNENHKPKPH